MRTYFLGALLMRLECENLERFEQAEHFRIRYTGAEANAAIAMCSLGAENVFLLSAVPDNPLGRSCLGELRRYGPDTSLVRRVPGGGRLGLFFLETGTSLRPSQVVYDRANSWTKSVRSRVLTALRSTMWAIQIITDVSIRTA